MVVNSDEKVSLQPLYEAFVADGSHVVSVTIWGVMADRFYTQGSKALDRDGFPTVKLSGFDLRLDKKMYPAVAKLENLSSSSFVFKKTGVSVKKVLRYRSL